MNRRKARRLHMGCGENLWPRWREPMRAAPRTAPRSSVPLGPRGRRPGQP